MLNHVTLLGRLAQDPKLMYTQSGTAVTNFDLAVTVPSKDRNAPPDYIPVVCWDKQADTVTRYLAKGRQIVVEGRISTRKYTDKDGNNRKAVEVTASRIYFADGGANTNANADTSAGGGGDAPTENSGFSAVQTDDECPF